MNPRTRKTTATVLAGSVALASAAYAIGSQSGGGTSGAAPRGADGSARARGPAASLAQRLGVSEEKLRAAFEDIRRSDPRSPESRLARALSDALGIPEAKVRDALRTVREQHESQEAARRERA